LEGTPIFDEIPLSITPTPGVICNETGEVSRDVFIERWNTENKGKESKEVW